MKVSGVLVGLLALFFISSSDAHAIRLISDDDQVGIGQRMQSESDSSNVTKTVKSDTEGDENGTVRSSDAEKQMNQPVSESSPTEASDKSRIRKRDTRRSIVDEYPLPHPQEWDVIDKNEFLEWLKFIGRSMSSCFLDLGFSMEQIDQKVTDANAPFVEPPTEAKGMTKKEILVLLKFIGNQMAKCYDDSVNLLNRTNTVLPKEMPYDFNKRSFDLIPDLITKILDFISRFGGMFADITGKSRSNLADKNMQYNDGALRNIHSPKYISDDPKALPVIDHTPPPEQLVTTGKPSHLPGPGKPPHLPWLPGKPSHLPGPGGPSHLPGPGKPPHLPWLPGKPSHLPGPGISSHLPGLFDEPVPEDLPTVEGSEVPPPGQYPPDSHEIPPDYYHPADQQEPVSSIDPISGKVIKPPRQSAFKLLHLLLTRIRDKLSGKFPNPENMDTESSSKSVRGISNLVPFWKNRSDEIVNDQDLISYFRSCIKDFFVQKNIEEQGR